MNSLTNIRNNFGYIKKALKTKRTLPSRHIYLIQNVFHLIFTLKLLNSCKAAVNSFSPSTDIFFQKSLLMGLDSFITKKTRDRCLIDKTRHSVFQFYNFKFKN